MYLMFKNINRQQVDINRPEIIVSIHYINL